MRTIVLSIMLFWSCSSIACQVDPAPFKELVKNAKHIFIGAIVEIHWYSFEERLELYPHTENEEEQLIYRGASPYTFRAVPEKIFKGDEIPKRIRGGYCQGGHVKGESKYLIMTYREGDAWGSKAYPVSEEILEMLKEVLNGS